MLTLLASDSKLHLIHADRSVGRVENGEKIRYLVGSVEAYQDTVHMVCDRAVFYEDRNIVELIGNVLIDDTHHKLWADKIIYYSSDKRAHCSGNVRISGVNDSLFAQVFLYNFSIGDAVGKQDLFIWDKQNQVRIWGDDGTYFSKISESHISGNAVFHRYEPTGVDTLIIHSGYMSYYGSGIRRAVARDSVRIFKGTVRAVCDSATYLIDNQLVYLQINPLAWQGDSEMKSDQILFTMDSLKIKEIFLEEKAQVTTLADSASQKYNVLKGKSIQVSMAGGTPERVIARRNAVSIYEIKDRNIDQGTNSASSDSIIVHFTLGEVDSISIIGGTEGTFYPADWKGEIKSEY